MKRLFALFLLMPIFLAPSTIISTENHLQNAEPDIQYEMSKTIVDEVTYYQKLPERPVGLAGTVVYADKNLTRPVAHFSEETVLEINTLLINDNLVPVFELKEGQYVIASQRDVANDVVLSQNSYEAQLWLNNNFTIYAEPYYLGASPQKTSLSSYHKVAISEVATTRHGTYLYITNQGWVKDTDFSQEDNRIEKVEQVLTKKYQQANLGISVKQLETGKTTGINQTKVMYSASITKLPLLYYVQHQLDIGKIQLSDKLKYIPEVHNFDGAYDPAGSGSISKKADHKDYSVEKLLKAVAQESDNVATNILGYYVAEKYGADYQRVIEAITPWDMTTREVSADTASQIMTAIYQQNGVIIDYLSETRFDNQRIAKAVDAKVAHKIGDAYDFRHDVAIIYSDNPYILSIFTEKMTYDDISSIAKEIDTILK